MAERSRTHPRRQMLFIAAVLGVMAGSGAVLAFKAIAVRNYALLAILPALVVTAIPLLLAFVRLRREQAGTGKPEQR